MFLSEQYRTLDEKSRTVRLNGAQNALSSHKVQDFLPLAAGLSVLRPDSYRTFHAQAEQYGTFCTQARILSILGSWQQLCPEVASGGSF